jgi:hypothetical protein
VVVSTAEERVVVADSPVVVMVEAVSLAELEACAIVVDSPPVDVALSSGTNVVESVTIVLSVEDSVEAGSLVEVPTSDSVVSEAAIVVVAPVSVDKDVFSPGTSLVVLA